MGYTGTAASAHANKTKRRKTAQHAKKKHHTVHVVAAWVITASCGSHYVNPLVVRDGAMRMMPCAAYVPYSRDGNAIS